MNIIIMLTYSACNTFGLQIVYSVDTFTKETLIIAHQYYKKKQNKAQNVYLNACITICDIIVSGHIEPNYKQGVFKLT